MPVDVELSGVDVHDMAYSKDGETKTGLGDFSAGEPECMNVWTLNYNLRIVKVHSIATIIPMYIYNTLH